MTTIRQASEQFDTTEDAILALVNGIVDDSDLWDDDNDEITDAGMEVLAHALTHNLDPTAEDLLLEVEYAAKRDVVATAVAELIHQRRDDAIRAAVAYGHNRTDVARLALISRERLYQII